MALLQVVRLGPFEILGPMAGGRLGSMRAVSFALLALAAAWGVLRAPMAAAQELEPRAYSASPIGANFVAVAYTYSSGAILFDPTVPVTDARARVDGLTIGYGRTFGIGRFQALALVGMPYAWGSFTGQVVQRDSSTSRAGPGDIRAKLSVNWVGPGALSPAEFASASAHRLVVGTSFALSAPTGQYQSSRLINIGANRWAFKPELGIAYNWRQKWFADCYGGATFFTANTGFYPGSARRQQDRIVSVQGHLSYTMARRTWAALESTWYGGGATRTNGGPPGSRLDSTRLGALLAIGVTPGQSIKLSYSYGASVRVGQNFGTLAAAYQWLWF